MKKLSFIKMHGLGNDFVIIDSRKSFFIPENKLIQKIASRKFGIGCDQLILIDNCKDSIADFKIIIFNSDGSEAETCGNAVRCVGKILLSESAKTNIIIETKGGLVDVEIDKNNLISVDMGIAKFNCDEIPMSHPVDTNNLGIDFRVLKGGFAINIGNPHVVFFNDVIDKKEIDSDCEKVSKLKMFSEGVNVNVAKVVSRDVINLQVYERGCGFTDACGSGACATLVAASKLNLVDKKAKIRMIGGDLEINLLNDSHVLMTGSASNVFEGNLNLEDLK